MDTIILESIKKIDNIQEAGVFGTLGKAAGKTAVVGGAAYDAYGAYDKFKKGDYTGAAAKGAMAALGAASMIPGPWGWVASGAYIASQFGLDWYDEERLKDFLTSLPKDADPEIATVQIALTQLGFSTPIDGRLTQAFVELFNKHKTELENL